MIQERLFMPRNWFDFHAMLPFKQKMLHDLFAYYFAICYLCGQNYLDLI